MSKIPPQQLLDAVKSVLAPTKPRKFLESVDLQVNLKNYDTQKDKRFSGSLRLPNTCKPNMTVCIICDAQMEDIAKKDNLTTQTMDDLKKLNKNKKLVKKLCSQYDAFLAAESVIKTILRDARGQPEGEDPRHAVDGEVPAEEGSVPGHMRWPREDDRGGAAPEHRPDAQLPGVAPEEELAELEVGVPEVDHGHPSPYLLRNQGL
jgi:hypothetical protein